MAQINWSFFAGQSLAIGEMSTPALSADPLQSPWATKLDGNGHRVDLANDGASQQPFRTAAEVALVAGRFAAWNNHAEGGRSYDQLKKGTAVYNDAITRARAGAAVATSTGDSFVARAVHIVHGESNSGGTIARRYQDFLNTWLRDFDSDLRRITGQTTALKAFVCQLSNYDPVALGQLQASRDNPNMYMVCPKYQLPKVDGLHLTNAGSYWLGEYHGRVHKKVIIEEQNWLPLSPRSISQVSSRVIRVRFHVPVPPLRFSTIHLSTQFQQGFSFVDSTGSANMMVSLFNEDTVELVVSRDIVGTAIIRYGAGNLCDSEPYVSAYDGTPLPNWCVQFSETISFTYESSSPASSAVKTAGTEVDISGNPVVQYQRVNQAVVQYPRS